MSGSEVLLASLGSTDMEGDYDRREDALLQGGGGLQSQQPSHAVLEEEDQHLAELDQAAVSAAAMTRSKRIPYWLWIIIARSLGIKLQPDDKPIVSSILHILTLGSGAGMLFTRAWFSGYDIRSVHSATNILDGMVAFFMVSLYCAVGVYAHRLAYRLFVHPKFLDKLRLHSKTIMKLNTACVVLLVTAGFAVAQNLALANFGYGFTEGPHNSTGDRNPCQNIQIPLQICQSYYLFQLVFSFLFLMWNVIVAVVLISVARTHTIEIRRFLRELSYDAHLQDKTFRKHFYPPDSNEAKDSLKEYIWIDNDRIADAIETVSKKRRLRQQPLSSTAAAGAAATGVAHLEDDVLAAAAILPENVRLQLNEEHQRPMITRFRRLSESSDEDMDEVTAVPHIMAEQEIMHKYWKLVTAVRLTSRAFQRWVCSITVTILVWSTIRVVYWLSHTPTLYGVMSFILPLILLPLLASAYAEVNYEGIKVIQSIIPTPKRLTMFLYCHRVPIQMTAYGHIISYGTMGTVLAAIIAAFASKILLQEMNPVIN